MPTISAYVCIFIWWSSVINKSADLDKFCVSVHFYLLNSNNKKIRKCTSSKRKRKNKFVNWMSLQLSSLNGHIIIIIVVNNSNNQIFYGLCLQYKNWFRSRLLNSNQNIYVYAYSKSMIVWTKARNSNKTRNRRPKRGRK